jgi:hypothetical protein
VKGEDGNPRCHHEKSHVKTPASRDCLSLTVSDYTYVYVYISIYISESVDDVRLTSDREHGTNKKKNGGGGGGGGEGRVKGKTLASIDCPIHCQPICVASLISEIFQSM